MEKHHCRSSKNQEAIAIWEDEAAKEKVWLTDIIYNGDANYSHPQPISTPYSL